MAPMPSEFLYNNIYNIQMQQSEDRKEQFLKALGSVIETLRNTKNKSARLISYETGITKSVWIEMERGYTNSQIVTFCKIAEALGVPPGELLTLVYKKLPDNFSLLE